MRKNSRKYLKELDARGIEQDMLCINTLQETPWRINERVLEVLRDAWESGVEWVGLPPRENLPMPAYPFEKLPEELDEFEMEAFKEWKKARAQVHKFNAKSLSKRIQMERLIQLATKYSDYEEFYYVWQMDFRGRKYPVEAFLTPQSADYGKALLEFKEGTPMHTSEDARWLAIQGANVFGKDKIALADRELWAYMHQNDAISVANDPMGDLWWTEADKPWQFLAWCFEWAEWIKNGAGTLTRLACAQDGSCNGLQHLSAILRDEQGGKAVNLMPSELPEDIYADVANATITRLQQDHSEGHVLAGQLIEFGIDRSITKRSVMIVPYSGTIFACRDYILEALEEKIAKGKEAPWGEEHWQAATYLAKHVWDAISDVIVSASKVMNYIKYIGSLYARENQPMDWVTPAGFMVRQAYPDFKRQRIKTHISGSVIQLFFNEQIEEKINTSKTKSGASPNFIHSLDAAALTFTVNRCRELGITNFAMIHDSFGVPSPQAETLAKVTREEFVRMYEENDVLEDLRQMAQLRLGIAIEPPPERGTLDLQKVKESLYFFA